MSVATCMILVGSTQSRLATCFTTDTALSTSLGFGGYSTIWLAHDIQETRYDAVKVGIPDSSREEVRIMRELAEKPPLSASSPLLVEQGRESIRSVLDDYEITGHNGVHPCLVTQVADRDIHEIAFSQLFSLEVARAMSARLVHAVAYVHSRGFVHGDIKIKNILKQHTGIFDHLTVDQFCEVDGPAEGYMVVRKDCSEPLPPTMPPMIVIPIDITDKRAEDFSLTDTPILLSDYGSAFDPAKTPRLAHDCNSAMGSRLPEAEFEPDSLLSPAADIWSLAVEMWDLIAMRTVFAHDYWDPQEVVDAWHIVLGPMPSEWWEAWPHRLEYFDEAGCVTFDFSIWKPLAMDFQNNIQADRRGHKQTGINEEAKVYLDLMRRMLAYRPEERLTVEEVLSSEWMVKWALPAYERSREAIQLHRQSSQG